MQKMKLVIGLIALSFSIGTISAESIKIITSPNLAMTPGKLCDSPSEHRYPEAIAYCERDVSSVIKREVFRAYGVDIYSTNFERDDYKIDHLIPLCAGGSNDISNLWPQHRSAFYLTDDLESMLCKKMSMGRLSQEQAVNIILDAKTHLEKINQVMSAVSRL